MSSIFDLKPRHEEKPVVSAAPGRSGPSNAGPPPLPAAASDAAKSGAGQAPGPPTATEFTKSVGPATPPEPVKKSAPQEPSATVQTPEAAKSSEATNDSPTKSFQTPKGFQKESRAESVPVSEPVNIPEAPSAARDPGPLPVDEGEFELVLGRRQIASWLFVGIVLIAIFSAASYFVGKTSAPNCVGALADQTVPYVAPRLPAATIVPPGQEPNLDGSIAPSANLAKPASGAVQSNVTPQASAVSGGPESVNPATVAGSSGPSGSLGGPSNGSSGAMVSVGPAAGPVAPATIEPPIFSLPQPGALYLQMGAVDKGVAVVLAEGLRRQGFTSLVAPGPTEKIFRVLIGPLENQDAYRRVKAQVDAIDLSTFARRFQK